MTTPVKSPPRCANSDCNVELTDEVGRWDCVCGCGKSWCGEHGRKRKSKEMPGDKSYLIRVLNEDALR